MSLSPRRGAAAPVTLLALAGLMTTGIGLVTASPAAADGGQGHPTGELVSDATTRTSFTVTPSGHSSSYKVLASTNRSDLLTANLAKGNQPDAIVTSQPAESTVTVSGLKYSNQPYYYRVEGTTTNRTGTHHTYSDDIYSVGLQPDVPASVTSPAGSAAITWDSTATAFEVEESTDPNFGSFTTYTLTGRTTQFTPYGLTPGTVYYLRVRAVNLATDSNWSPTQTIGTEQSEQQVRVLAYNVLEASHDGNSEGGQTVAPWSKRCVVAAHLIEQANPDIAGIEEAASWVDKGDHTRQVSSLVSALGGTYSLAHTEIAPGHPGHVRIGDYILYKSSEYAPVGKGGHWLLSSRHDKRHAVYQIFQNKGTGAEFLFVDAHLLVGTIPHDNTLRAQETAKLIKLGSALAAKHNVPVFYGGDFNSHAIDPADATNDGPATVMLKDNINDSFVVAQHRTNAQYNSGNQYDRTAPKFGDDIDHVFTPAGVAVEDWELVMDLHHGKFKGVMASDHNPLLTVLDVPYTPTSS